MSKPHGKGSRNNKSTAKTPTKEPTVPTLPSASPTPAQLAKMAKKAAQKEKKALAPDTDATPIPGFPTPLGRTKPFVKNPIHAKWPALFKRHLGLIASHIESLDRIKQAIASEMEELEGKERLAFEMGERGNYRVICAMLDRARGVLASAREAAIGILPPEKIKDKKVLGVQGTSFTPLEPALIAKAAAMGYDPVGKGKLGRDPDAVDADGDVEMSDAADSSDSDSDSEADAVEEGADFINLSIGAKVPRFPESDPVTNGVTVADPAPVEPNPYFVVDTEPTPVEVQAPEAEKKSKKERKEEAAAARLSTRMAKKAAYEASKAAALAQPNAQAEPEVDFAALEQILQAEIAAGTKAQEEDEAATAEKEDKKSKKKRKRSSGVDDVVEKKARIEEAPVEVAAAQVEKKSKNEKKEKKEKKRKADESADGDEGEATKKKRKHKEKAPE